MSDGPPELVRPSAAPPWRERWAALAESLDLSARRLVAGLVALAVAGFVAWRVLAPPAPAAEMELPFAEPATGPEGAASAGTGGPGATGAGAANAGLAGAAAPGATVAGGAGPGSPPAAGVPGAEVVVHVAGAVARPGVQRLVGGDRVVDAVEAAGGAAPEADLGRINLAAPLVDGQQIYVPRLGEESPPAVGATGTTAGGTAAAPGQPVNLNTASADELDTLPGVGPTTAAAIIAHREANGPFTAVDQLLDVRGIGDAKLEALRDLVAV
ncbi:MAG TPA: helix-hairpin-helix domain-containing protein [Acidimicrobiales bacterium]|nr:helix-hairpin-helix domain-containing protein [Acidimicrobiales bacterium]